MTDGIENGNSTVILKPLEYSLIRKLFISSFSDPHEQKSVIVTEFAQNIDRL
jgi:hypothetical protein